MFIINILFLTILVFVSGVSTSVSSEDIHAHRRYVKRLAGGNYNYNHPPPAENIQPIPVSVVYDDDEIRQGKSISTIKNQSTVKVNEKTTEKITTAKPHNSVLNNKDSDLTSVDNNKEFNRTEETSATKKPSNDVQKVNIQNKEKRTDNNADDVQIPVAIVYEAKSDTQKDNNLGITNGSKRTRGNPRRRSENSNAKGNIKIKNNYPESQSNLSAATEAPQSATNKRVNTTNKEHQNETKTAKNDKIPLKEQTDKNENKKRTRQRDPVVPIVESENYVYSHNGEFHYSYEGGDGTKAFEKGELKSFDDDKTGEAVVGGFSYKDKDGNDFSLSYTADENGYRPIGAHLPTPPPIPPAIARALKYLATKTTPEPVTETSTN